LEKAVERDSKGGQRYERDLIVIELREEMVGDEGGGTNEIERRTKGDENEGIHTRKEQASLPSRKIDWSSFLPSLLDILLLVHPRKTSVTSSLRDGGSEPKGRLDLVLLSFGSEAVEVARREF